MEQQRSNRASPRAALFGPLANLLAALNERLRSLGYTQEKLRRRLGFHYPDEISPLRRAALVEREARAQDALAAPVLAFWLEAGLPARQLRAALGRDLFYRACTSGLLRVRGNQVEATLRAEPVAEFLVWADRRFDPVTCSPSRLPRGGVVYPPSSDSLLLAEILSLPDRTQVLDLGTGSGVLALLAARTAREVWAVDVSPRAVALASLNARACGLDHLTFRLGDLYRPVAARSFHAIVANPPFVPSPFQRAPSYHSGGTRGDRVLARIIRGWRDHLLPGGRAFTIAHFALRPGEALPDVAQRWLAGFDGRAILIELDRGSWLDFAAAQALYGLRQGLESYARELARWARFLQRQHFCEVAAFVLAAERSGVPGLDCASALPRVLPIPLHKTPAQILSEWWQTVPAA